jgi:hypothetical protein
MKAAAVKPTAHQNVCPNAAASPVAPAAARPAAWCWRITASTAVPNEAPTCWKIRTALLARGMAPLRNP